MDIFLEKIVKRRKTIVDIMVSISIILSALIIILFLFSLSFLSAFLPFLIVGIGYLAYMFVRNRSVEYEYIVTNGDLDIDMIIAQRKRKRIFSGSCKDFDMVAKLTSGQFDSNVQSIKKRINAFTSIDSPDIYFITATKEGNRTLVLFEPHPKMVESFKKYIPRKVFE
ncbi:hypothetical protein CLHUN_07540 [Ruminiclostridium hungatei]|uniref:Bacterial Pleckstrin homology domain-containing protein n=1 Tax=Ruminiclostridium hungatei TaxID=48256 RepID=A0A1V4SNG5_RUMHU|nr:DUF6106 family protein [Ruminiclostridium hungatei]OPX45384.1 hypothetical protein CLHUN_07540 [Ruminiclostridium hungatei]